jgi:amino acid transporter
MSGSQGIQNVAAAVSQGWPLFLLGSGILVISGVLLASGMKRFLAVHKAVFILALLGSVLQIVVLLLGSRDQFMANFDAVMGPIMGVPDPYSGIIASAQQNGWTTDGANWKTTLGVSNWAFLPIIGAAYSIAIAGEIKSVQRAQTYGMLGAVLVSIVLWVVTIALSNSVFGYDFLGSAVYNKFLDPATATAPVVATPTEPSINLLSGLITQSWLITLLCSIGVVVWIWMWIPGIHSYAVRAMVAWAFDRVAPDVLGTVSQKRHTPTVAIVVCAIIMIVFMALFVFTESFSKIVILIEAQVLAWSVVLLAGIFFPYKRPHIHEKSPIANKKVFGLPLMTVACALGFLASQFYFWSLFFDGVAAGHAPDQIPYVIGIFALGFVFYFVMRAYRASKGIDINLAFKEIPIE